MSAPPERDFEAVLRFTQTYPEVCDHVVDMPYRLCSPSAQEPRNRRLWRASSGEILAFGVVQQQFSTLDWATAPGFDPLKSEIFDWAIARLTQIRAERGSDLGFLIGSPQVDDAAVLNAGFEPDGWSMRHLSMRLAGRSLEPTVPLGMHIRPLTGMGEVEAYVSLHRAAFDSRNMSTEWRSRILADAAYQPALDLVAEDEQGRLVAFCIGWASDVHGVRTGQIEPLGVLPEMHQRGIGRAILLATLLRMQERGCEVARIDSVSGNNASNALYESVGFEQDAETVQYFRLF